MLGAGAAKTDQGLFRSAVSTLQAKSLAIVGASERARWSSEIFKNLREFGYPGRIALINPRQSQVFGQRCHPSLRDLPEPVDHALVIVPAGGGSGRAHRRGGGRRQVRHRLRLDDGRRRRAGIEGARRLARRLRGQEPPARRRAELHGRLLLSRAPARLSQHRSVPARAGLDRVHLPVRRHHPVLDAGRRRAGAALFLLHHVGQRARSRPRRLSQFRRRRSADPPGRAVHRRHPPRRSIHARRRPRARHGQAHPRHQDRRHREIAGGLAVPYRRDRRRLRRLSRHVRALRHRQFPLARRSRRGGARLRRRAAAEGPAHRLRHHLGRYRRSALRLRRDRRRGHARFRRRDQGGAQADDAGRHRAEKSARCRHSFDARRCRQALRNRGARSLRSTWWPGPRPCRARRTHGAT